MGIEQRVLKFTMCPMNIVYFFNLFQTYGYTLGDAFLGRNYKILYIIGENVNILFSPLLIL